MNNEPVAWWARNKNTGIGYVQTNKPTRMDKVANDYLPLYTHPAKTDKAELDTRSYMLGYADGKEVKTLTDEEIIEVFESPFHPNTTGKINDEVIAFAKAILRKAQER